MDDRSLILNNIFKNGKMKHFALKYYWYEKNNLIDIYNKIFEITPFLNSYDNICLRERIFYIENNLKKIVTCPYCNTKLKYNKSKVSLRTHCGSSNCKKLHASKTSKKMWSNFSEKDILSRNHKISKTKLANPIKYTDDTIQRMREAATGRKFSKESNEKRIQTRRKNNKIWHTDETKQKISKSNKNNFKNKNFYNEHLKRVRNASPKISKAVKEKIVSGKFTPPVTNSWTNWDSYVNDGEIVKKFRSSWECVFWLANKQLKYEYVRIPYIDDNKKNKIYIVDFVDENNNILYEIKPKSIKNKKNNLLKEKYALQWCKENGYTYIIIDNDWFIDNIKLIDFSNNEHLLKPMKQFL